MPPPDYTNDYNTKLSASDERKFQKWSTDNGKSGDLYDYDLRGWWKKNGASDERGHMTDEFKKPNHPTFSEESGNHSKETPGGVWGGTDEKPTFTPSAHNLKNMTKEELKEYFSRVEPDAELVLPKEDETDTPKPSAAGKRYDAKPE